ncbi:MAG TPA: site-specific integrase [Terriglobales bacterium]|nr:site-specific integrase [Terriglobales bacterium]
MSLYRRGSVYWYKFRFAGQQIRESAKTTSKTVARDAERSRRRELELGFNRIPERKQAPLFSSAAKDWLATKANLAAKTKLGYEQRLKPVNAVLGQRLACDVGLTEVVAYRVSRLADGASNRTVNYEVACIRGVLKRLGLWASIAERIQRLRENHDVGRALTAEHEEKLLRACRASQAPSLLPLFIFARDTGLRASEMKALQRRDLHVAWKDGLIVSGEVIVPLSKTEAGTGRSVPLSADVCSTLTLWLSRFPEATGDSYVFPHHEVQMLKGGRESKIAKFDLSKPMQSWQRAWRTAQDEAGVHYRWHDLRHTFVSRLAENPAVSEQTIRALAGHVSRSMLERYSHIRTQAKQTAIAALEASRVNASVEKQAEQKEHATQRTQ